MNCLVVLIDSNLPHKFYYNNPDKNVKTKTTKTTTTTTKKKQQLKKHGGIL